MLWYIRFTLCEFPHSDIRVSTTAYVSSRHFVVCHVLLRLLVPRHSPHALFILTYCLYYLFIIYLYLFFWLNCNLFFNLKFNFSQCLAVSFTKFSAPCVAKFGNSLRMSYHQFFSPYSRKNWVRHLLFYFPMQFSKFFGLITHKQSLCVNKTA